MTQQHPADAESTRVEAARPHRRRRVALGAYITLAVGALGGVTSVWFDVLLGNFWPMVQALVSLWLILAVTLVAVGLGWAAVKGWKMPAIVAVVLALASAPTAMVMLTSPEASSRARVPQQTQHRLTIISANLEYGGADAADVVRMVRNRNADVVVFVELTVAELQRLDAAGLKSLLPHRSRPLIDGGAEGSMVLSRFPVTTRETGYAGGPYAFQMPVTDIAAPGGAVRVVGVHTFPPVPGGEAAWRPQLRQLDDWQRADESPRLIMAGDFNASRAHPAYRRLSGGLLDATAHTLGPNSATWPQHNSKPPFTQIDHILTRGFAAQEGGMVVLNGTDHAAIWNVLRY